jgi:hypothetical protein
MVCSYYKTVHFIIFIYYTINFNNFNKVNKIYYNIILKMKINKKKIQEYIVFIYIFSYKYHYDIVL